MAGICTPTSPGSAAGSISRLKAPVLLHQLLKAPVKPPRPCSMCRVHVSVPCGVSSCEAHRSIAEHLCQCTQVVQAPAGVWLLVHWRCSDDVSRRLQCPSRCLMALVLTASGPSWFMADSVPVFISRRCCPSAEMLFCTLGACCCFVSVFLSSSAVLPGW